MRPSGPSETDLGEEQAEAVALEELFRDDEGYLREPDLLAE